MSVVPAVIRPADEDLREWDAKVDEAEGDGIRARWEYGHALLRRRVGKQLPAGFLDEECAKTGKTRRELGFRMMFAERYTMDEVCTAVQTLKSWTEIRDSFSGITHVSNNSGDNEWYTPAEYIAAARAVMGGIDLDPASSPEANEVVQADTFYTLEDDGLSKFWKGKVWMNPPYGRPLIDQFCAKLAEHYAAGSVTQACVISNNATETGWFHALAEVAAALCFPRHRVRYWKPGKDTLTPLQGQAVIYLGEDIDKFRDTFVNFGVTAVL